MLRVSVGGTTVTSGYTVTTTNNVTTLAFTNAPTGNIQATYTPASGPAVMDAFKPGTVQISVSNFALLLLPGTNGAADQYALTASGSASLVGVPEITSFMGSLTAEVNTGISSTILSAASGAVQTAGGPISLNFSSVPAGNAKDIEGSITLQIGGFVSISGNFGIQEFTDGASGLQDMVIGASQVMVTLGTSDTNLTISGASFGLLVVPSHSVTDSFTFSAPATSFALTQNPANDANVTVSVGGTTVTTGYTVTTMNSVTTLKFTNAPTGNVQITYTPASGPAVTDTFAVSSPTATLSQNPTNNANITVTVNGTTVTSGFTTATTNGVTTVAFATTPTGPVKITYTVASGYALVANGGTDSLTFPGNILSLTGNDLQVMVNTLGYNPNTVSGLPTVVKTGGGNSVPLTFTQLGSSNVEIVEGAVTLTIANFVSLSGDFGFEEFTDHTYGTEILVGADNVNTVLGTATTNLSISGASFGLLIIPDMGYALLANGGTDTLNGVPGVTLSAQDLTVKVISAGLPAGALTAANAEALTVPTPDGGVLLDFAGLTAGAALTDIEGQITLGIANFVSLSGSFAFEETTVGGVPEIVVGADSVNAMLGTSSINLTVSGASLAVLIVPAHQMTDTFASPSSTTLTLSETPAHDNQVSVTANGMSLTNGTDYHVTTTGGVTTVTFNSTPAGPVVATYSVGSNYALHASSALIALNGIPSLTLTAGSLAVNVNTGLTAADINAAPAMVQTPTASIALRSSLPTSPKIKCQG